MRAKKLGLFLILILLASSPLVASSKLTVRVQAQAENTLSLPGLQAPVTVIYDTMGIPHIYAENSHDLFMAQGYVHSVDRFWQMDWWRHYSAGRRSEIGGASFLGFDRFVRTLNFTAAADRDLEVASDEALAALYAYAAGVNAYIGSRAATELAREYEILAERGIEVTVDAWTPNDTIRWLKVMALGLSGNFQDELFRAGIIGAVGNLGANFLIPAYPFDQHPVIVEPGGIDLVGQGPAAVQALPAEAIDMTKVAQVLSDSVALETLLETPFGHGVGIGSNSWVIGPGKTDSGMTYLANDPHLGIQNPSIWYEVGLHCTTVSDACPYNVVGVGFGGSPGVVIGHTDRVAWGFTNVGTDVQDLYLLTVNPDNPMQYMLDGEWVDFEVVNETFNVQGSDSVELQVLNSVWGPVISSVIGFEDQTFAIRWVALDANTLADALLALDRAQNWDDFRTAATFFDVPAQNMLYADVDGNIGYQTPGKVPIRAEGHDPRVPVDGSTTANAWQGYVPFEEMPSIFNPEAGYIVTANNSVVGKDYPYYLTADWDYGYRAIRIETMIQNDADGLISIEDMRAMHGDNYNIKADYLVPALQALTFEDSHLTDMVTWLAGWDHRNDADSSEAALFEAFWAKLLEKAFADDLGFIPGGDSLYWYLFSQMVANPEHVIYGTIWDDSTTADVRETANDIMAAAFTDAVALVTEAQGDDPAAWSWGAAHVALFEHELFNRADIEAGPIFNFSVGSGGGSSIVNATGWDPASPYGLTSLPSMRQILIPQAWDSSLRINTYGQSGNPDSPHHHDQMEAWAAIDYHPDLFSREAVEGNAETTWELVPE